MYSFNGFSILSVSFKRLLDPFCYNLWMEHSPVLLLC